ncbi:bifunctional acetate--CoA ligase family protein/GNAT family N-acetyltransferase [Planktothrix paucivesiculata]|uniref:Acetyl-CoA synthetase n=1 Tax=Planktothrix paucivesiculata PCC 9631 TaxID=671071 RepID=A0A7Z9E4Q1_9CYAN|nr:bifunctional acetate--CoA ligase family protein/GNAT family N-acetyltransferase [Planktothrix paucivesiculata]VXD22934.1 Acetyl-CoA synthetase [Planktothrix paucivesiculata PCC 9631]
MVATTTRISDPAHDVLRYEHESLNAIFNPKTVAVIGATEKPNSVGRTLLWNLISSPFGGMVFPVNPHRNSILGIKAYPSIKDTPEPVDLAIIATPASSVPGVMEECANVGVKGVIILSAGFKEIGPKGIELEQKVLQIARSHKMRIIGPNCLGLMNPLTGLNATFANAMAKPGTVGFISQSGALCTSILDWSFRENVGFSAFVSIGSMLDIGWGDLIYYLGNDPHTESIVIYMESIGDARSFLSAAREVALTKPIIVIKAGRTEAAAKAAASHTGAMAGSDDVLDAAFRRCGILRVYHIAHLFSIAELLSKQPRPKGPRLTILTNAGGPGVLTTDTLIGEGGTLAQLSGETLEALNQVLPPQWSHANPIDILGDADPERYAKAFDIVVEDPNNDGILVILTPQAMTDPSKTAAQLKERCLTMPHKPILASWMGGADVESGIKILNQANIATFAYPDSAVRMFNYMWRYTYNLKGLYETPSLPKASEDDSLVCDCVQHLIDSVLAEGRTLLTEFESKRLLAAYGIPTVQTYIASTPDTAVNSAEQLGYPVVLKLLSKTITHKTDVGGVKLNLNTPEAVLQAYTSIESSVTQQVGAEHFQGVTVQKMVKLEGYELIIGSSLDVQFGPVLLFGMGGQLVEVFKDRALALPPLNTTLARRMMEQTKIYKALLGVRGRHSVDMEALKQLLVRFSNLVVEQPWIKEIDINPLLASENELIALDARVVLHSPDTKPEDLPKPAIRPYPRQYITPWTSQKGMAITIRPIRPEDEPLMVKFDESLSEESVYLRYAHLVKLSSRVTHERLSRLCFIDYDREMALVAEYQHPETGETKIIGVGRLSKGYGNDEVEFSLLVSDSYQRQGIGTELLRQLLNIARQEKMPLIFAEILSDNRIMQNICQQLGFTLNRIIGEPMVRAEIQL